MKDFKGHAQLPDERGRFGGFGGRFVPETLMAALLELEEAYDEIRGDPTYWAELRELLTGERGSAEPDRVREILETAAREHDGVMTEPPPAAIV